MPIYEYTCNTCLNRFERMRPMTTSREASACPNCGSKAQRALSVFAAFARDSMGNMEPISGGGCGCGVGGACQCSAAMGF